MKQLRHIVTELIFIKNNTIISITHFRLSLRIRLIPSVPVPTSEATEGLKTSRPQPRATPKALPPKRSRRR